VTDKTCNCPSEAHVIRAAAEGCAESRLLMSRRAMLGGVTAGLFSWAFMPRFAEAATSGARLLVVVLRGGMDGINVCVPFGDQHYNSMRRGLAIPAAATIKLDNFFGLHPALKNFGALYKAGEASIVHATCVPLHNRSHFDCQDNLENGLPGNQANATGWLNRLLSALPPGAPIKSAGAIQIGEAPLILRGPAPVLGWSPTWFSAVENPTLGAVRSLYNERDQQMYDMLQRGLEAHRLASRVGGDDGNISELRKGFRGAARLLAAPDGPRIAVLSVGGWDTHADQGATQGFLAGLLTELDTALADFKKFAGSAWQKTVVVCATEFGRTVRTNGDAGTDHGVGTVALLAGGAVKGRRIHGDWPGLAPNQLYEQSDLKATTDLRSVFKGVLRDHIGVSTTMLNNDIFPESTNVPTLGGLVDESASSNAPLSAALSPARVRAEAPIAKYRRQHGSMQQASLAAAD
jgi:uncharacterized protein (DUF1501 family)